MNTYEFTFLVSNEKDAKNVKTTITSLDGKIIKENNWGGERALTFPVKKQSTAHYITWEIQIDAKTTTELKKKLNYDENVLRYLLLQIDSK